MQARCDFSWPWQATARPRTEWLVVLDLSFAAPSNRSRAFLRLVSNELEDTISEALSLCPLLGPLAVGTHWC
jgi:hypothetical protein